MLKAAQGQGAGEEDVGFKSLRRIAVIAAVAIPGWGGEN